MAKFTELPKNIKSKLKDHDRYFKTREYNKSARILCDIAETLLESGYCEQLLERLKKFKKKYLSGENWAWICSWKGQAYDFMGEKTEKIENEYNELLNIAESLDYKEAKAQAYTNLGYVHWRRRKWDTALECFENSVEVAKEIDDEIAKKRLIARNYNEVGVLYRAKSNLDEALRYFEKSVELSKKAGDRIGLANTYSNLGMVYDAHQNFVKAKQYYQKSLEISEEDKYISLIARAYTGLGFVCYHEYEKSQNKDGKDQAVDYFERAVENFGEIGCRHEMAQVYFSLGSLYKKEEEWDKAIECCKESVKVFEAIQDCSDLETVYKTLSAIYRFKCNQL